jgi:hypothetical protein
MSTNKKLSSIVHTYYPRYARSINKMVMVQVSQDLNVRPYSKTKSQKALRDGSGVRAPAWQAQSL